MNAAFAQKTTTDWLSVLEPADIWCANVYDYDALLASEGYKRLAMEQWVTSHEIKIKTTRCPVRVDGDFLVSEKGAPALGEHNAKIIEEFGL